jgi:Domain of unknown function (DUF4410)
MRWRVKAACGVLYAIALAGCAEVETSGLARPNLIVVREFAVSPGVVTLDPSFGFSLYRGSTGVPPRERAASVGRAAAFNLADTVVEQLHGLGYDAIRADAGSALPAGRALVVTGAFRQINEGHRRHVGAEDASIAVSGEIDYQSAGAVPRRLTSFSLDSRQVPRASVVSAAAGRGSDVNSAAVRVGQAVARAVVEQARRNSWPGASR